MSYLFSVLVVMCLFWGCSKDSSTGPKLDDGTEKGISQVGVKNLYCKWVLVKEYSCDSGVKDVPSFYDESTSHYIMEFTDMGVVSSWRNWTIDDNETGDYSFREDKYKIEGDDYYEYEDGDGEEEGYWFCWGGLYIKGDSLILHDIDGDDSYDRSYFIKYTGTTVPPAHWIGD